MRAIELKDWIGILLTVWSNVVATIAFILTIQEKKKKTAPRKPSKRKRKR